MKKLYCYVDETGQDTKGKIFLVSIVISGKKEKDQFENKLFDIEKRSGKNTAKWTRSKHKYRIDYLSDIFSLKILRGALYYGIFNDTKEYVALTTFTIAQAIYLKTKKDYHATIIIDGLNTKERERVLKGLKIFHIKYRKVRGLKEEASPFLRLADAIAGFLRDYIEDKKYAKKIARKNKIFKLIHEIKK